MFIASRLREMDAATCMERLQDAQYHVGRLAWDDGEAVTILPVNFVLDGRSIVIRTGEGIVWKAAQAQRRVGFEVDAMASDKPTDDHVWSVLVRGQLEVVEDADELTFLRLSQLQPEAGGLKVHFVRLPIDEITGRRT